MIEQKEVESMTKQAIANDLASYTIAISKDNERAIVFIEDQLTGKDMYRVAFGFTSEYNQKASTFYLDVAPSNEMASGYEDIVNRLVGIIGEWFKAQLEAKPKYHIHVLPSDYGYLAYDKLVNMYQITSLEIAEDNHMQVEFTQAEIDDMDNIGNQTLRYVLIDKAKEEVEG